MCSGSEAGSYSRLVDFVYHSTLGLRVIKKKMDSGVWNLEEQLGLCGERKPRHGRVDLDGQERGAPRVLRDVAHRARARPRGPAHHLIGAIKSLSNEITTLALWFCAEYSAAKIMWIEQFPGWGRWTARNAAHPASCETLPTEHAQTNPQPNETVYRLQDQHDHRLRPLPKPAHHLMREFIDYKTGMITD